MNSKIYQIGFFVLLAVNVALVSFMVFKPKGGPQKRDMREKFSKELGLTEEQKSQFMEMAKAHREQIREMEIREAELFKSYFGLINQSDSTTNQEVLLAEINALKTQKILLTYQHFENLKAICNEEQQAKFDKFLERVIPIITGSHRRGMRKPK